MTAKALETLYLEKHALDYTGAITYYAFVEDNFPASRTASSPSCGSSTCCRSSKTIRWSKREAGGSCNGNSVSLEELIARQRENLNRTFALRARNDRSTTRPRAGWRNMRRELHAATAELAQGIAAIAGPIPALDEAVAAMQSAAESLERERPGLGPAA